MLVIVEVVMLVLVGGTSVFVGVPVLVAVVGSTLVAVRVWV